MEKRSASKPSAQLAISARIGKHASSMGHKRSYQDLQVSDAMEKSGLPFVFWVGICPALVISDPEDGKLVSNACIEKTHHYRFFWEWLGDGLLTAPGHIWKKNIKMMIGAFSSQVVNNYQPIFNDQAKKLVEIMKTKINTGPFDAKQIIAHATLEAICQTALGIPEISKSVATNDYYVAFTKTLEKLIERGLNIFLYPQFIYNNTKAYKEYIEYVTVLRNVSGKVLDKLKRNEKDIDSVESDGNNDEFRPRVKSFLDIMVHLSKNNAGMTEEEIKSEINSIIFAGQETVATTLHFIFIMIGSREDVQKKLHNEIKEIFGDTKRDVNREDLERMLYCEGVIYETLRLYPPVPLVLRKVDTDIQLSCLLPKGTYCAFNVWASGRSERLWGSDVLEFRPERWRDATPPILAFSIGKRACIGKRYAIQILKTMLAYCIQGLVFKSDPDELKLKIDVTLRTYAGDLIEVGLRNTK